LTATTTGHQHGTPPARAATLRSLSPPLWNAPWRPIPCASASPSSRAGWMR
jgi:hypothetical protein